MTATPSAARRLRAVRAEQFAHIRRMQDNRLGAVVAKILPGEFYATSEDEYIVTTLGSCVSACLWHPDSGIGGMNHFMLPDGGASRAAGALIDDASEGARYGSFAMEHLINAILATGLRREDLVAKIVGGGHVLPIVTDIGASNIAFVRAYLAKEGIVIVGENVGGNFGRQVRFHPATGRAQVRPLAPTGAHRIVDEEAQYRRALTQAPATGDVELF
ncbi:MAG: chemoreceptor glutamine deamidase CheD [Gammaproteobacteria bacterium]